MAALVPTYQTTTRPTSRRPSLRETFEQSMAMAWRALLKMRRNPEQFFDVTLQPLLFTAMFTYIFGGAVAGSTADYLPITIPGILAHTTPTACTATATQLRLALANGVCDR